MMYSILQIRNIEKCGYAFMGWNFAEKFGFNLNDYDVVYKGEITKDCDDVDLLEDIYVTFNMNKPEDFEGHSLAVSDIVNISGRMYYCNSFGWEKI